MQQTLIIMVGLPRSGKSTKARELTEKFGYPIVNPDSVRLAIHGQPFIASAEPYIWAVTRTMIEALFIAGHRTVILDACSTTKARRDEWKSDKWVRRFIEITAHNNLKDTHELCIKRALGSFNSNDLVNAINRMYFNYEPVSDDENMEWWNANKQGLVMDFK